MIFSAVNLGVTTIFLALLLVSPVVLDTTHMSDTLLIGHIGWRGLNGAFPVVDYPHFYGGVTAYFVALSFDLFGVSYFSVNTALAMMFGASGALLCLICWQRVSSADTTLFVVLAAMLVVAAYPIELGHPETTQIARSFAYNHVAMVLMLAVTVFATRHARTRPIEIQGALAAGVALYVMALLKPTFAIFIPCILLACVIQRRWLATAFCAAGVGAIMLLVDPSMTRVLGSLDYLLGTPTAVQTSGLMFLIKRGVAILIAQLPLILICCALLWLMWREKGRAALPVIMALILCGGTYSAAMVTTGLASDIKMLPIIVTLLIVVKVWLCDDETDYQSTPKLILASLPACVAYALILPVLLSALSAYAKSVQFANASLIDEGPFAHYFVLGSITDTPAAALPDADARRAEAVTRTRAILTRGGGLDESGRYAVLADGIALLQDIPDVAQYGIIPNEAAFEFTMPLMSKVVLSFPTWPTPGMAQVYGIDALPADVDIVMLTEEIPGMLTLNDALIPLLDKDFQPCRTSEFWTLYIRNEQTAISCTKKL